jgi:beta-aspartyl-dipeptidase (metallo-type)
LKKTAVGIESLYPTHISRTEVLMREAIHLAQKGMTVDLDTVDEDLSEWLPFYLKEGGPADRLTLSSDAAINSPATLYQQVRECTDKTLPLEKILPFVTVNPARILQLKNKGRIATGHLADLVILDRTSLDVKDVFVSGKCLWRDGSLVEIPEFLKYSNRRVELYGQKASALR